MTLANGEQKTLLVDVAPAVPIASPPVTPATALDAAPAPSVGVTTVVAEPHADAPSHRGLVYVAGGIGVASLAVAGVTGGWALGEKAETSPACDPLGRVHIVAGRERGKRGAYIVERFETGALLVAGVALGVAIVAWATEPHAHRTIAAKSRGAHFAWTPAPNGVAVVW